MKQRPTITIGIPAYNEEANIKNLLDLILSQRRDNFELKEIIVISDGSTDNTEKIVQEFAKTNSLIKLISDGKRIGKAKLLNRLYQMNTSDYLITLDADIEPEDEYVFEKFLEPLRDPQVAVVAGNMKPLPGRTLVEKLVVAKDAWWYEVRKNFKGGNNIYNSTGCCFVLSKHFVKSFYFRDKTVNDQEIIYLEAKRQNKKFIFCDDVRFFYREASTWRELISRMRRFERQDNLESYGFGINIEDEYRIPFVNKMHGLFKAVSQDLFYGIGSLFLVVILKFVPLEKSESGGNNPALWKMIKSSKKLHKDTATNTDEYSCEVVHKLDEKYVKEWQELWERSRERNFFNSPDFFQACLETFNVREYSICFCYRKDELCATLPLVKGKVFGIQAHIIPGGKDNYIDKAPLLVDEYSKDVIKAILSSVQNLGHLYIAELDELAKSKIQFKLFRSFSVVTSESPVILLSPETNILENMSGNKKRYLNSRLKKNKELLSFEIEKIEALEKIISVEEGSYRSDRGMDFFNNELSRKFMISISKHIPDSIKIGILYMQGKPIATTLGFVGNNTFYWYHTAFLEQYRSIGPGKIALYLTLEHFKKIGFTRIDLLRGNSDFKRQFSRKVAIQYDAYFSKNFLILIWWRISIAVWKKLKQINLLVGKRNFFKKRYKLIASLSKFKLAK